MSTITLLVEFTIGDFTNLVFDTTIVSITLYRIWNLSIVLKQMWLKEHPSITSLLVKHGRWYLEFPSQANSNAQQKLDDIC